MPVMMKKQRSFMPYYAHISPRALLKALIEAIRKGHALHIEYALRKILHYFSYYKVPDVLYGCEIPLEIRLKWRKVADDAESANEVFEYLIRQGKETSYSMDFANEQRQETPLEVRKLRRMQGIDPESDNEVAEFLMRHAHYMPQDSPQLAINQRLRPVQGG